MILRRDHVAGGAFVVAGALILAVSGDLPFGTLASPGAGMLPKLVIGLMMAFGLVLLLRAGESPPFADVAWSDFPHAVRVVVVAAAAIALYTPLGFLLTMSLLLFGLIFVVERRPLLRRPLQRRRHRHAPICCSTRCSSRRCRAASCGSRRPRGSDPRQPALGFSVAFRPDVLLYAFLGCLVGTLVGMLPGIGPLAGISILLPVTFGLDATKAIVMLAGIYYGSQYGGSTTSILMRIPGEAASVMTCIDGYAMAQKGRAGAALCIAAVGSFVAGTFGVVVLTVVAPPLANFALRFGPPEYTALLVLGLVFLAYMSSTSLMRTLLMAAVGLLLGCIGIDVMTGHFRYSFDIKELGDGIGIVPVAVGLFGLGEILSTPSKTVTAQGRVAAPARTAPQPHRMAAIRPCRSRAAQCSASSSASCRARRTSSRASSPTPWRSASPRRPRNSARARSPASPARNRPTTPPRPAPSCRCWH